MPSLYYKKNNGLSEDKRIELKLSFPYQGRTFVKCQDLSLLAKVVIINHTDTVASFYEDWNMWGYYNIIFQIKTDKGIDTIVKGIKTFGQEIFLLIQRSFLATHWY